MSKELPNIKHKGLKEPLSYSIIRKAISDLFPSPNSLPSNEGSNILGELIYVLFLGLFGRSIHSTGYSYQGTPEGNALFDSVKIIRILVYFFSNTIITIFFKDIETMYLNEHHSIDEEFFGLGLTLRQIHGSLTNGIISFVYSMSLNKGMIGGGEYSDDLKIDINEIIKEFFIEMSFEEFKNILGMNDIDPYNLKMEDKQASWDNSFSKVLFNSKTKKHHSPKQSETLEINKIKKKINELSNLKEKEINEIIQLLDLKKPKKSYTKPDYILDGGGENEPEFGSFVKGPMPHDSKYAFPGNPGSVDEQKKQGNRKYFFYKLFLLESLFNSKKFLDSFEVMFNLLCRLINRLIKRIIPLIRKVSSKTINNMGAFLFSLGGPFTEILWFGFSSMLSLIDVGEAALNLADDYSGSVPVMGPNGAEFVESSLLRGSEPNSLNELLGISDNLKKYRTFRGGGGCNLLKKFDKQVKHSFFSLF